MMSTDPSLCTCGEPWCKACFQPSAPENPKRPTLVESIERTIARYPKTLAALVDDAPQTYGRRNISKMLTEWRRLADACRAEGTPAIQAALDDCEEWIDFAFPPKAETAQPES